MRIIISYFMVVIAFFTSVFTGTPIKQEKAENFVPVLRFMACSDTHVNSDAPYKLDRINKAISFSYDVAENDEAYNSLDAVLFAGDLTDNGYDEQFVSFDNCVKNAVKGDTQILAVVAKNHDSYQGKKSIDYCEQITGNDSDFHVVINGYHFIGISTCKKEGKGYTMAQRIWLEKQLRTASKDDPEKPIFVMHHEHVMNTVYGSKMNVDGWGNLSFKDIIAKYSQVIDISGHSHYPLNDPRSIWQGTFTAIGTGSMSYMEFTVDGQNCIHTEDGGDNAQAWLIEVDASNRVRLRGFDVLNGEWLCDYLIEEPSNILSYAYTQRNQKALSSAPEFEKDAKLTLKSTDGKLQVSVPAAQSTDGKPVFLYRITVTDKNGDTVYSEYKLNNYWTVNTYETVTFEVEASSGCTVSVTAENCYNMQSSALTAIV